MKLFRNLIIIQSGYYFLTAIWSIISTDTFMMITGPKTDTWLVKTVGALLIPISLTLASYIFIRGDKRPAVILGSASAIAFIVVDFYFALTDTVSDIYLADGLLQIILFVCWIIVIAKKHYL